MTQLHITNGVTINTSTITRHARRQGGITANTKYDNCVVCTGQSTDGCEHVWMETNGDPVHIGWMDGRDLILAWDLNNVHDGDLWDGDLEHHVLNSITVNGRVIPCQNY